MSYEHRSNIHKKKISFQLKVIITAIILLLFINFIAPKFLSSFFTTLLRPFWGNEKAVGISIELTNVMIQELQKENTELKLALNRATASSTIMANILKKPPFSAYDIYIIDVGLVDNIHAGDKVYAVGDVLLGEISEVNTATSKVKLYSSYGERYDVLIGKNIEATAIGKGGGSFEVILPRDIEVAEGDIVTIRGLKTTVFGIIKRVVINPVKTFSTILFSQPVNIYEQRIVLIERFASNKKVASDEKTASEKTIPALKSIKTR